MFARLSAMEKEDSVAMEMGSEYSINKALALQYGIILKNRIVYAYLGI